MNRVGFAIVFSLAMVVIFPFRAEAAQGFYLSDGIVGLGVPGVIGIAANSLDLGYGINNNWGAGLKQEDLIIIDTFYGRYNFDRGQRFVPYVDAGISSILLSAWGFNVDLGGNYYLGEKKRWFIGGGISYSYIDNLLIFGGGPKFGYQWKKSPAK